MKQRLWIVVLAVTAASASCNGGTDTGSTSEQVMLGGSVHADAGADASSCADAGGAPDGGKGTGIVATVRRTVLLSDQSNPDLVNAWGLAFNETAGPAWIAAAGTGKSLVVDAKNTVVLTVTLPASKQGEHASPTGIAFNRSMDAFKGDAFVFVTEGGTVTGWQRSNAMSATTRVDSSASGAIYKGATIAGAAGHERLYATDFHNGKIDVFDRNYETVMLARGAFVDATLPSGYAPFNADAVGNLILVTYAKQGEGAKDDAPGAGNGFIDVFDMEGTLLSRLASNGPLDSPWGLAITPDDFGAIPHRLLVGNFGDGRINVYNVTLTQRGLRASFEGQLGGIDGTPLAIGGLWALRFPTGPGFDASALYFTAGPGGEAHGAYGRLDLRR
jgi:uncharacterized protein (TIGR03118 family)